MQSPVKLYSAPTNIRITDLAKCALNPMTSDAAHYHCLATSKHVLWIDDRMPGYPVLQWLHHRPSNQLNYLHELPSSSSRGAVTFRSVLKSRFDSDEYRPTNASLLRIEQRENSLHDV